MILRRIKIGVALGAIFIASQGFSQQKNVTSAAVEYQSFQKLAMQDKGDEAIKTLLNAKKFIDLAVKDPSTEKDAKAHYYNTLINMSLMGFASMDPDNVELKVYQDADSMKIVLENSIAITKTKKRWKEELEDFFNMQIGQAIMIGEMSFKAEKYDNAFVGFASAYEAKKMAGIEEEQEAMKTNAIISGLNQVETLKKAGKTDEAMEFVTGALELFPESDQLAIAGVNLALENDDLAKAEEYFQFAAKASPNNKELFANMGSIYLTEADKEFRKLQGLSITDAEYPTKAALVEELYGKSESNLLHAVKIDPNYALAQYNLGVLYLGQGERYKGVAAQMNYNDPELERTQELSVEWYTKAIAPLEEYIKQDPDNAGVLMVLFQVHRNAGNDDKAMEYKRKADALSE